MVRVPHRSSIFSARDADEKVNLFTSKLLRLFEEILLERTTLMHPTDNPWITSSIGSFATRCPNL